MGPNDTHASVLQRKLQRDFPAVPWHIVEEDRVHGQVEFNGVEFELTLTPPANVYTGRRWPAYTMHHGTIRRRGRTCHHSMRHGSSKVLVRRLIDHVVEEARNSVFALMGDLTPPPLVRREWRRKAQESVR